ncbi:MAG TPA: SDR family NAD(P)-dependent oxidoreductase [Kiritimatiellia bacterium]|nr:SDR family NAD(P)-dependent oxidoreductase [Kiritimatiellia bacterium]HRZ12157.1 SDR family NAD(P)-dependent oxidoreductase [Kiritimatiellia bacterium]HSA18085.1 SDR family NAD(P)-dependent oxidoreductase [Kiritimatiellia bacterium]
MKRFADQGAVITGAGSGMGRSLAAGLAAEGARVCLVDRDEKSLAESVRLLGGPSPSVGSVLCDLTVDAEVSRMVQEAVRTLQRVDLLAHSAGAFRMGAIESLPVAELDFQYRVNTRAPYALTQTLLPELRKSRGQVLFVNSSAGLAAGAKWGAYSATKAALKMLADSLRAEVNADGIRVLSIFPGRTAGPMQEQIHRLENRPYHADRLLQPDSVAAMALDALALPRTAEVTDVSIRPMMKSG